MQCLAPKNEHFILDFIWVYVAYIHWVKYTIGIQLGQKQKGLFTHPMQDSAHIEIERMTNIHSIYLCSLFHAKVIKQTTHKASDWIQTENTDAEYIPYLSLWSKCTNIHVLMSMLTIFQKAAPIEIDFLKMPSLFQIKINRFFFCIDYYDNLLTRQITELHIKNWYLIFNQKYFSSEWWVKWFISSYFFARISACENDHKLMKYKY